MYDRCFLKKQIYQAKAKIGKFEELLKTGDQVEYRKKEIRRQREILESLNQKLEALKNET